MSTLPSNTTFLKDPFIKVGKNAVQIEIYNRFIHNIVFLIQFIHVLYHVQRSKYVLDTTHSVLDVTIDVTNSYYGIHIRLPFLPLTRVVDYRTNFQSLCRSHGITALFRVMLLDISFAPHSPR